MTLQDAIAAELPGLRAEAESRMLDTFEFRAPTGGYTMVGGIETPGYTVLLTALGQVKVSNGLSAHDAEVGDRTSASVTRVLKIAWDSPVIPTGTLAVCTAVHELSDPTLLNAVLRVDGPAPGSQTTARRLQVSEVLS